MIHSRNINKTNLVKSALCLVFIATFSSCKLPGDYRGTFSDQQLSLKIGGSKATLTLENGRKITAKAAELNADVLGTGKPGLYLSENPNRANEVEVLWVHPKGQVHEQEGLIWMDAEVVVTRMIQEQDGKAQEITLMHCEEGMVLADRVTGMTNGGCPPGTEVHTLKRK